MADALPPSAAPPQPRRRLSASIALICVGLLILVPSGLFTAMFTVAGLAKGGSSHFGFLEGGLTLGLPPTVLGVGFLIWGLRRDRRR